MKLKTIFATAILAIGAISLPSMAITQTAPSANPWAFTNFFGCTWQVIYNNGGTGSETAIYKPVGTCQYSHMIYSRLWSNNYVTLTAN